MDVQGLDWVREESGQERGTQHGLKLALNCFLVEHFLETLEEVKMCTVGDEVSDQIDTHPRVYR